MDLRTPRDSGGPATSLTRPTDQARRTLQVIETVLAGLAVLVAVSVGAAATLTQPAATNDPQLVGVLVALAVLLICWALLGVAVAWRSCYLNAVDRRRWTAGWARVEPTWSGRR